MGLKRRPDTPALIVPDEETWLAWGDGLAGSSFESASGPGGAHVLLLPERVPHALVEAVRSGWRLMPQAGSVQTYEAPLPGIPARHVLATAESEGAEDAGHGHEGHGEGHDHGDMMAITGEPSADGLVMESMDVRAGPLGAALPGGLVVAATLDGDVVEACDVHQTLREHEDARPPDVLARVAWRVAELAARELTSGVDVPARHRWLRLAAVEVERAVAHLGWLHQLCRLLGWPAMTDRVRAVLRRYPSARHDLAGAGLDEASARSLREQLRRAQEATRKLAADLADSRLLARRTEGLGRLTAHDAIRRGLAGPIARASGVVTDARLEDPAYRDLAFEPVSHRDGDARARAVARAEEADQAARLAAAALAKAGDADAGGAAPRFAGGSGAVVEGARGPVQVRVGASGRIQRAAPGTRAALEAARELAVGREWAAALVTVASFDLSPWQVDG